MRIRQLNKVLYDKGLGLMNMGGYDAQTFVGAMSTSTHGSGLGLSALPDTVLSLEIVVSGGIVVRIEPTDGPTDIVKFQQKYPDEQVRKLIQDDDYFNAIIVNLGSMGVIYSVTIQARKRYWLKERRYVTHWKDIRAELAKGDILRDNRHVDLYMSPYGDHLCVVSLRNETPENGYRTWDAMKRTFAEFLSGLPLVRAVLNLLFNLSPRRINKLIEGGLKMLVDGNYTDRSYKVLNLGNINQVKSLSAELAFPMANNQYLSAVDELLGIAKTRNEIGKHHLASPLSLRFVKASKAWLSPQYDRDTCMVEIVGLKGSKGYFEVVQAIENAMYAHDVRMHWGQVNTLNGSHPQLSAMYPALDKWLRVFGEFNGNGKNTFHSPFTKRLNLT
jgi:hypothetical protein